MLGLVSSVWISPALRVHSTAPVALLMMELALDKAAGDTGYVTLDGCQHAWEVEHAQIGKRSVCKDGTLEQCALRGDWTAY